MTIQFRNQNTISKSVSVQGVGYWSGLEASVEFRPAAPDTGIAFIRADISGQPRIAVQPENCVDIPRRTCIQSGSACVEMIEHLMAALAGLQIDNCEIWVDRAEVPAFDGSCIEVVEKLQSVDLVSQAISKPTFVIEEEIRLEADGCWIAAYPHETRSNNLTLTYQLDYEAAVIGQQEIELVVTPDAFKEELASARTFLLEVEAEWLRSQGLGRSVSFSDLLVFGPEGLIGNTLRYSDECVRHKALDAVGDLAVAGFDIAGHVVAHKSGHRVNGLFVKKLVDAFDASQGKRLSA